MVPEVKRVETAPELAAARAIRHAVFVVEQGVPPEVEVDGLDVACEHFLVLAGGAPVATARTRRTPKGWKIERVAVLGEHRRRALGSALITAVLDHLPAGDTVYIHAQESALGFWERAGFVAEGPGFEEGGISHRVMRNKTPKND